MKLADFVVVGAALLFLFGGDKQPSVPTNPGTKSAITYLVLVAEGLEQAAEKLDKGEITTDYVLKQYREQRVKDAWNIAWRDGVATAEQAAVGQSWTPQASALFMRDVAKGLREAAR